VCLGAFLRVVGSVACWCVLVRSADSACFSYDYSIARLGRIVLGFWNTSVLGIPDPIREIPIWAILDFVLDTSKKKSPYKAFSGPRARRKIFYTLEGRKRPYTALQSL